MLIVISVWRSSDYRHKKKLQRPDFVFLFCLLTFWKYLTRWVTNSVCYVHSNSSRFNRDLQLWIWRWRRHLWIWFISFWCSLHSYWDSLWLRIHSSETKFLGIPLFLNHFPQRTCWCLPAQVKSQKCQILAGRCQCASTSFLCSSSISSFWTCSWPSW